MFIHCVLLKNQTNIYQFWAFWIVIRFLVAFERDFMLETVVFTITGTIRIQVNEPNVSFQQLRTHLARF